MVLNAKRYQEIMKEKGLKVEDVSRLTGLTLKSINWVFANGYSSVDAQERMASALGVPVGEIVKEEQLGFNENTIEFEKDGKTATLSLSQGRYKSRIRELAKSHPEECEIVVDNKDGSMCAHVPVAWVKITPPRNISEEHRKLLSENARNIFRTAQELDEKQ